MHFLLGHSSLVFKTRIYGIMHRLEKEKGKKREISSLIFPFCQWEIIVSLQLKAEQNRKLGPDKHRGYFPQHRDPHRMRKTYTSLLRGLTHLRSDLWKPLYLLKSCSYYRWLAFKIGHRSLQL